jgi:DNA-binding IclR family transcriptional regulator
VDRAVSILELLADVGAAGVTEIATELKIHKSTAFRLLMTLEARGLVEQDVERGKYRVGYTAVQLTVSAAKVRDIAVVGRPVCTELAATVGETVSIAVKDGLQVLTVDQTLGYAAVTAVDSVGKRQPLHATAAGKVFLAEMSGEEVQAVIDRGLPPLTQATLTDGAALRKQLDLIRNWGYATTYEEAEIGLVAIAVPVRGLGGGVVAALAISGPMFRVNEQTLPGLLAELESAAARFSWRVGYVKRG